MASSNVGTRVADTIFSGISTDRLATQDVYKVTDSTAKNTLFDAAKSQVVETAELLRKRPGIVSEAVQLARSAQTGAMSKAEIAQRVAGVLQGLGNNPLSKLTSAAANKVYGLLGVPADAQKTIGAAIGSGYQIFKYADVSSVRGIADLLGDISGSSSLAKFFDMEAEAALFSGVLDDAIRMGVTESIDLVKQYASHPEVWQSAFVASAGQAILSSDLETLNKIIDDTSADKVLGENPNAIADVLSNFRLANTVTPEQYSAKLGLMKTVLGKLNPTWWQYPRNGRLVLNYAIMAGVSDDAKKVLDLEPLYRDMTLTAPFYQKQSVSGVVLDLYPGSSIGSTLS